LTPGATFAGYVVERMLGRGGMGAVFLARHPRLSRSDALKLMSEELSRNDVYRQRFVAEADIACQVQHESVVRVYDRGEDDGRLWLTMEYVDGRDLAQILSDERRLPVPRAVALTDRIAAGLDAIHAKGLLHRDVKPANILVTRDVLGTERALLTDFGIARSAADSLGLTGVGDIVATLHYAAPEQFELRSGELDRRVDVYALGCVLYEMLTGRVPLEGDSVAAFWQVMQTVVPAPPSRYVRGIPPLLDAVLAKALSKNRDDRFATAGELARAARDAIASPTRDDGATRLTVPPPVPPQQPGGDPNVPFRIGLRRSEPSGGSHQFGPLYSEQLAPADVQRISRLITSSGLYTLPASLGGGWGPETTKTVEAPGRYHTVSWKGQPPPLLAELTNEVERLAGRPEPTLTGRDGRGTPPAPQPTRKRKALLLSALAVVVIAAVAVALTLVLTGGKEKPGTPGSVKVTAGRGTVTMSWAPGSGKTDHYVVYRDDKAIASSVTGTTYVDKVSDTKRHSYAVQAVNASGTTSNVSPQVVTAAQVRPLNTAETRLINKLPSTLVYDVTCKPILSGVDGRLDRAVTCDPGPGQSPSPPGRVPQAVEVYGAASADNLNAVLNTEITEHAAKSGSCSAVPQEGTWNFTETPTVVNGKIICYTVGTKSYLIWSYTAEQMYVRVSTTNSYASLIKWWQGAALRLP
jgi:serine/threonine protein kinase